MKSYDEHEQELEDMTAEERIHILHYALRNIPRRFIIEYVTYSEQQVEDIFNAVETSDDQPAA